MTLLVWAACDAFAVVLSDRKASLGNEATVTSGGQVIRLKAEKGITVEGVQKIYPSADGTQLFALSGEITAHTAHLEESLKRREFDADQYIAEQALKASSLADAHLLPSGTHFTNCCLHAYARDGKNVCAAVEWTPMTFSRIVRRGGKETVDVALHGSGLTCAQYILASIGETWQPLLKRVDDWREVTRLLRRLVQSVGLVEPSVGAESDAWLMLKDAPTWRRLPSKEP